MREVQFNDYDDNTDRIGCSLVFLKAKQPWILLTHEPQ